MPDWADDRHLGQRLLHLHTDDPEMRMLVRRYLNQSLFGICENQSLFGEQKCNRVCVKELGQKRAAQPVYDAYTWAKDVNEVDHPLPGDELCDDDESDPDEEFDSDSVRDPDETTDSEEESKEEKARNPPRWETKWACQSSENYAWTIQHACSITSKRV